MKINLAFISQRFWQKAPAVKGYSQQRADVFFWILTDMIQVNETAVKVNEAFIADLFTMDENDLTFTLIWLICEDFLTVDDGAMTGTASRYSLGKFFETALPVQR